MKLIADFGNTLQKIARFRGEELVDVEAFQNISAEQLIHYVLDKGPFTAGILSAVIPVSNEMLGVFRQLPAFLELDHKTRVPVKIDYKTPETLGRDRIALVVGASVVSSDQNALVIGAGSCITYDLVTADRHYPGGAISPGINMRLKALHTFTGKLPLVQQQEYKQLIGVSTTSSILSGVINGVVEEVKGFIGRYRSEYPDLKVILTGGDQEFLYNYLKSDIFAVPELVLQGLNKILDHNGFSE
jgi:type III pantothenate kinase